VNAFEFAAGNGQIARLGRARAKITASKSFNNFSAGIIFPTSVLQTNFTPSFSSIFDAAQHDFFFVELHVRNAIHEQAARTIGALKHRDFVAGLVQLCGGESPAGPEPMTATFLPVRTSAVPP
jgi:hypothetical protein